MPTQNIRVSSFMGGVSTLPPNQRLPIELESMDNCDVDPGRGTDKRAGTEHIDGEGSGGELNVVDPTNDMHVFWINRDDTERFVVFIDPDATSDLDVIQAFNIITGAEVTVQAKDSAGAEVALDDADADVVALIGYLRSGTQTPQQRFRTNTVEDGTFILNRSVITALEGAAITYVNTDTPAEVRNQNNDQHVTAFSDFAQPPTDFGTYPTRATLVTGGSIGSGNDRIWYAEDDDIGLPQGFYFAVSGTQPPWYQRLPTEGALSFIQRDTMPVLLAFDGTKFILQLVDWEPRKSGDSTTNPGPTFIGNSLDDIEFHQGRLWFCSGERFVSSRAGDIFNLWIDSTSLQVDDDPIDDAIQGNRVSNIRLMESFRDSLIMITTGARQVELRANGPLTPFSYQQSTSTDIFSANYVEPTRRGSQMYFAGERDAAMLLWEYDYSPQQVSNIAQDITRRIHGYIPAQSQWMTASNAHEQLFVLSLADTDAIYVNTAIFEGGQKVLNSWFRWVYSGVTEVVSCEPFDDHLYLIMERNSLLFLERQALGEPLQENDGNQTLGYALRIDRKAQLQGVYNSSTNQTVFTLPYLDAAATYQMVTGPSWDTATVKGAGTQITGFTVGSAGGFTTLTLDGDYENNADGTDAPCYVGIQYEANARLSEILFRNRDGIVLHGNNHLMRMRIRHKDSGGYSIKVTPDGRSQLTKVYTVPQIGSTPIDSDQLDDFGEFQLRIMAHSRNTIIELVNDTPFPTAWIDADFDTTFVPSSSPVR